MTNLYKIPDIQWLEETTSDTHRSVNTIREYVIRPNSPTNPESSKPKVVCYNGKPQKYFDSVAEAREWVETVNYPSVVSEYLEVIDCNAGSCLGVLNLATSISDPETAHGMADDALCDFVEQLGFKEIVVQYKCVEKWYA